MLDAASVKPIFGLSRELIVRLLKARVAKPVFSVLALSILGACVGLMEFDTPDQSVLQAEAILPDPSITLTSCPAVEAGLVRANFLPPLEEKGACGHPAPFSASHVMGNGEISLVPEAKVNCVILSQFQRYLSEQVQPLAMEHLGQPVVQVDVAASYSCRTRNGKRGAKLSEHGRMNAIDVAGLRLADGRRLTIKEDWKSFSSEGTFLRAINRQACRYFTTVIGPGGDAYHQDHLHMDHASHGRTGKWRVCQ